MDKKHKEENNGNSGDTINISGKNVKMPLKMLISIVVGIFSLGSAWFSIHQDLKDVKDTLVMMRNEDLKIQDQNTWILTARIENTNGTIFPSLDEIIETERNLRN